jgi:hypothetical protein
MDHKDGVEHGGFLLCEFSIRPEHIENVLGDGILRSGIVDDQ